jgi:hypothetical protein
MTKNKLFSIFILLLLVLLSAVSRRVSSTQAAPEPRAGQPLAPAAEADVSMYSSYTAIPDIATDLAYLPLVRETSSGWHTQLAIQNLTASPADVWIGFRNENGDNVGTAVVTIPGWSPYLLDLATIAGLPADFEGSATVYSYDGPVGASVHITNGKVSYAYSGAFELPTTLFAAGLMCDYSGYDSKLIIQNLSSDLATVTVSYSDGISNQHSIPSAGIIILDQNAEGHTCSDAGVFNANIQTDKLIAAVVELYSQDGTQGSIFEAMPFGWTVSDVPYVARNAEWWMSTVVVHNAGNNGTNVTATYEGQSSLPAEYIDPADLATYNTTIDGLPYGYHGSLHLDSDNDQSLDVSVLLLARNGNGDVYSMYTPRPVGSAGLAARHAPSAMEYIYFPLVPVSTTLSADNRLWDSTLVLENVGASDLDANVYFYDPDGNQAPGSPVALAAMQPGVSTVLSATLLSQAGLYAVVVESTGPLSGIAILGHVIPNQPPYEPTDPSPADGATGVSLTPTLSWTGGDPDGNTVTYYVYGRESGAGADEEWCGTGGTTSCQPGFTFKENTTYLWLVRAYDSFGSSAESAEWQFTTVGSTGNQPPYAPSNPSPANGATGVSLTPTLSWTGGDPDGDTVTYTVVGEDCNEPSAKVWCAASTANTCQPSFTFEEDTSYCWMVTADDGNGGYIDGPTWMFETLGGATSGYFVYLPMTQK